MGSKAECRGETMLVFPGTVCVGTWAPGVLTTSPCILSWWEVLADGQRLTSGCGLTGCTERQGTTCCPRLLRTIILLRSMLYLGLSCSQQRCLGEYTEGLSQVALFAKLSCLWPQMPGDRCSVNYWAQAGYIGYLKADMIGSEDIQFH